MDLKAVKEAVGSLGKIPDNIYNDLFQPATKKAGKALETVLDLSNTILLPIKLLNLLADSKISVFEHNIRKYEENLKNIQPESLTEVRPELGLPIIDKLTYTTNEYLSDLFINLLTSGSKIETQGFAHPSFVTLITNLSVDEAQILHFLSNVILNKRDNTIPCIWYELEDNATKGIMPLSSPKTGLEEELDLLFPESMTFYLQNLEIQGILLFHPREMVDKEEIYTNLEEQYNHEFEEALDVVRSAKGCNNTPICEKGYYQLTDFGKKFIAVAVNKKMQQYI
ncbi:DUF4393 domain-containing protein [Rossellomorea vietnamensis]|uniref:DUF4393 domain-containing protein n=1 Tax=Rossellomorea vietnamensis TaxID=218284 RepID=UPI003CEA82BE